MSQWCYGFFISICLTLPSLTGRRTIGDNIASEQAMKEKEKEKEKDTRIQVCTSICCCSFYFLPFSNSSLKMQPDVGENFGEREGREQEREVEKAKDRENSDGCCWECQQGLPSQSSVTSILVSESKYSVNI